MKNIFAVTGLLLALSPVASFAAKTVIINECPHEMWVALGYAWGGGSDDIGAGGSWSKKKSIGWYRIGPYQREEMGGNGLSYAFIKTAGDKMISAYEKDAAAGISVGHFCFSKNKFDITLDNNRGPVVFANDCRAAGGSTVVPFQAMFNNKGTSYGTFTLRTCD